MTSHSRHKRFRSNRRGFSSVIATIFMVLAVLFMFFNVYMFMQKQDTNFQDAVIQSQQLDADRDSEEISIYCDQPPVRSNDKVTVNFAFTNNGTLPIKVVRAWLIDRLDNSRVGNNASLATVLSPNESVSTQLDFTMGVETSGYYQLEIVSSRGNLFSKNIP